MNILNIKICLTITNKSSSDANKITFPLLTKTITYMINGILVLLEILVH